MARSAARRWRWSARRRRLPPRRRRHRQHRGGDPNLQMRQDYEFAERVGTKQAWTYFLQHYPDGFYANLAKAQLDKLTAGETPADRPRRRSPAHRSRTRRSPRCRRIRSRTTINPADLARSVQTELKRVGCYSGAVDGDWSTASRARSTSSTNMRRPSLDTKLASSDALDALRAKPARVCPLVCDHGFRADGDSCARIVCKDGYQVGDDNTCEKIPPKTQLATDREPKPQRQQQSQQARQSCACADAAVVLRAAAAGRRRANHLRRSRLRPAAEGLHRGFRADRPEAASTRLPPATGTEAASLMLERGISPVRAQVLGAFNIDAIREICGLSFAARTVRANRSGRFALRLTCTMLPRCILPQFDAPYAPDDRALAQQLLSSARALRQTQDARIDRTATRLIEAIRRDAPASAASRSCCANTRCRPRRASR